MTWHSAMCRDHYTHVILCVHNSLSLSSPLFLSLLFHSLLPYLYLSPVNPELEEGDSCNDLTVGLVVGLVTLILGVLLGSIVTIVFLIFHLRNKKYFLVNT